MSVHTSTIQNLSLNEKVSRIDPNDCCFKSQINQRLKIRHAFYNFPIAQPVPTQLSINSTMPPSDVYTSIKQLLASNGVTYREVTHEPTRTSEESAKARGSDLSIGGKAILLKVGETFRLFVLSAAKKLDSQKIKEHFDEKRLRFATPKELQEMTGLVPGSVPPFGRPVTSFDICLDVSVTKNTEIAFNAGMLTTSIIMRMNDYLKIASPEIFEFSMEE